MTHPSIIKARETIARVDEAKIAWAAERAERERAEKNPFAPIRREWKAPEPEPQKVSHGDRDRSLNERNAAAWDAFVQGHIDLRLESFSEMLGEEVGKVDGDLYRKIAALELRVGALQQTIEKLQRGDTVDRGSVIELPNWRGTNAA